MLALANPDHVDQIDERIDPNGIRAPGIGLSHGASQRRQGSIEVAAGALASRDEQQSLGVERRVAQRGEGGHDGAGAGDIAGLGPRARSLR